MTRAANFVPVIAFFISGTIGIIVTAGIESFGLRFLLVLLAMSIGEVVGWIVKRTWQARQKRSRQDHRH